MMGRQEAMAVAVEKEAGGGASLLRRKVVVVLAAAALTAATMALSASPASAEALKISDPSGNNEVFIDPSTGTFLGVSKSAVGLSFGGTEYGAIVGGSCNDTCSGAVIVPDGEPTVVLNGQVIDLPF